MLGFVQNFFASRANPIGVDFGSDCLRLAQVQQVAGGEAKSAGSEYKLVAAACADVPHHVRFNSESRVQFFVETTRELLSVGKFQGRQAILALPAASMFIQHLRVPKMDEEALRKGLAWEARGKLPIDPSQALLRHLVAGEVYQDQEPKYEVVLMAAARDLVNQFLAAASKAKLDVVGMNVEPKAMVDCFGHVYRRKTDSDVTNCFIDIGCTATRAVIARGQQIYFARVIPVGGDHFSRAVAQTMSIGLDEAKLLRIKLCGAAPALDENREKHVVRPQQNGEAASAAMSDAQQSSDHARVESACREPLSKLIEELDLCRRYYEATFPNQAVERLIFIGGEARQRSLCQQIARELGVAAQLGDPLVRMGRISDIPIESGIDRRQPQPSWAVAIGLSLGPLGGASNNNGKPIGSTAEHSREADKAEV